MKNHSAGRLKRGTETIKPAKSILIKENKFLKTVLDSFPYGIFIKDSDSGKYILWNEILEKWTKIQATEIINKNDKQIFGSEKAVKLREQDETVIRKNAPCKFNGNIYLNGQGKNKIYSLHQVPVKNDGKKIKYLIGIIRDETRNVLNYEKLKEKENLLKKIFSTNPLIIYSYDLIKKKNTVYNDKITDILGYSLKDLKNFGEILSAALIHPDERIDYEKQVLSKFKNLSGKNSLVSQFRLKVKGKREYKWILEYACALEKTNKGKTVKTLCILTDITEIKNLSAELQKSREKLDSLEKTVNMGYWEYDFGTKKSEWTNGVNRIFEIEIPGKIKNIEEFLKYIPKDERKYLKKLDAGVLKGNQEEITHKIKLPSGKEKYLLTRIKPWFDDTGKMIKASGTSVDITGRVEAEIKLQSIANELRESNKNKEKFFSIIAHDLRSPFTGLLGYASVLKDDLELLSREEIKNYVRIINTSLKRVYNLIENLLQWSKIQSGKLLYNPDKIDLFGVSDTIIKLLKPEADSKKINLVNEIKPESYVHGDDNMLRSVFQNLISNSIKFCNDGGSIIISAEEKNNFFEISVNDTGIGMKREVLKNLFKTDTPLTTLGTKNEKGSGLGLILCNEFINRHNSRLNVNSEEGIGTTFYFKLKKFKQ